MHRPTKRGGTSAAAKSKIHCDECAQTQDGTVPDEDAVELMWRQEHTAWEGSSIRCLVGCISMYFGFDAVRGAFAVQFLDK